MTQQITLGGRSFDLPRPTIPYLLELAEIVDTHDGQTLAAALKRNIALIVAAVMRSGAEFDPETAELSFSEVSEATAAVMEAAGFAWRTPVGEAAPAAAGSPTSSTTSSQPSLPAADTAGPGTTLN